MRIFKIKQEFRAEIIHDIFTGEAKDNINYRYFTLALVKDTKSDKYRFINLTYDTIFKREFDTKERAEIWLYETTKWKVLASRSIDF